MLDAAHRADVVTARQTIRRAVAGEDADLAAAAAYLDRLLRDSCPHDPAGWHATEQDGERFVICPQCGAGWFVHDGENRS